MKSLLKIAGGSVEILEFIVEKNSDFVNKPLKKIQIASNTIIRKREVVIPHGNDVLKAGDRIIVITKQKNISELEATTTGGLQSELFNGIKKFGDIANM